jgi:lipopolysaccharide biosynthesis glycosyltransferase
MLDNKIHVALAADHGYAAQMEISILSVIIHNPVDRICFEIIDNGLSEDDKKSIIRVITDGGAVYRFHKMVDLSARMGFDPPKFQNSYGLYGRLFLPELMPNDNKVIYLDCDTLILRNLSELYDIELGSYWVGGVKDTISINYLYKLGLVDADVYINSGVLLINLDEWRKNSVTSSIISYIKSHSEDNSLPDQDAINVVCKGNISILDPCFNVMSPLYLMSYENIIGYFNILNFYSKDKIIRAKKDPCIVHFTGYPDTRPWQKGCHHPLKRLYKRYEDKAELKIQSDQKFNKKNLRQKIKLFQFRYLPYKIYRRIKNK